MMDEKVNQGDKVKSLSQSLCIIGQLETCFIFVLSMTNTACGKIDGLAGINWVAATD